MSEHNSGASMSGGKIVLSPFVLLVLGIGSPFVGDLIKDRLNTGQGTAATAAQVQMLQERVARVEDGKASKDELLTFERDVRSDLEGLKNDMKEIKDVMLQRRISR